MTKKSIDISSKIDAYSEKYKEELINKSPQEFYHLAYEVVYTREILYVLQHHLFADEYDDVFLSYSDNIKDLIVIISEKSLYFGINSEFILKTYEKLKDDFFHNLF